MKNKRTDAAFKADRRAFLKMGAASLGAGGAVISTANAAEKATENETSGTSDNKGQYRETEHIRKYYKLARF